MEKTLPKQTIKKADTYKTYQNTDSNWINAPNSKRTFLWTEGIWGQMKLEALRSLTCHENIGPQNCQVWGLQGTSIQHQGADVASRPNLVKLTAFPFWGLPCSGPKVLPSQIAWTDHDVRFRKLGINLDNMEAEELWEILDADQSGEIDEDHDRCSGSNFATFQTQHEWISISFDESLKVTSTWNFAQWSLKVVRFPRKTVAIFGFHI